MLEQMYDEKAVMEKGDSRKSMITDVVVPLNR